VTLATGLIFGLVPAIRATRGNVRDALAETSRTMSGRDGRLRGALVMAEIGLALVLLTGAGLMVQSFVRLRQVELGFRPAGLATMTVDLPDVTYRSADAMRGLHAAMLERLASVPGVASAAAVNFIPLGGAMIRGDFKLQGRELPRDYLVAKPSVSPGYFRTMGITLLRGREFTPQDVVSSPGVVIVSKSVADQLWSGTNPIGQRLSMKDEPGPGDWLTVVGVVDDVGQTTIEVHRDPAIYQPIAQLTQTFFLDHMSFVVRATTDPGTLVPAMRQAMREIDPSQQIGSIGTMDSAISATVAEPLFQARLIGVFSVFALLLAGIGIYGVVSYTVVTRTREIGIRMALGAAPNVVRTEVLRSATSMTVGGIAAGTIAGLFATKYLESTLYGVTGHDPVAYIAGGSTLLLAALLGAYVPARRSSKVDPISAIRAE
jgi:putative ABC transport system permease protein